MAQRRKEVIAGRRRQVIRSREWHVGEGWKGSEGTTRSAIGLLEARRFKAQLTTSRCAPQWYDQMKLQVFRNRSQTMRYPFRLYLSTKKMNSVLPSRLKSPWSR